MFRILSVRGEPAGGVKKNFQPGAVNDLSFELMLERLQCGGRAET
jgi:hypothetical protein